MEQFVLLFTVVTALLAAMSGDFGHLLVVEAGSSSGSGGSGGGGVKPGSSSAGVSGHHFPTAHGSGTTYVAPPTTTHRTTTPRPQPPTAATTRPSTALVTFSTTSSTIGSSPSPSWTPRHHHGGREHGSGGRTSQSPWDSSRHQQHGGSHPQLPGGIMRTNYGGGGNVTSTMSPDQISDGVAQSNLSLFQMILFAWFSSCLALLTVIGNILVMVSFKIDKQLQTISNYFLFSLAMADFCVGFFSMPLFTIHILMGYWPFGSFVCDTWLALDYLVSNASVLNLLIISFDRYFSVTRPLTYRARRTTRRAAVMISSAWGLSLMIWPPWIYAWPYIEGKRTVPPGECYIQFIETNHYITFGTAIAAFYVPVSIMIWLYFKIWRETEKRQRDLSQLQAGKKESSRRSNSSDEVVDVEEWKRMRSESCICQDHLDQLSTCPAHQTQSKFARWCSRHWKCFADIWISCSRFCRVDRDADDPEELEDEHVSPGCGTPASVETPLQSSVSRCTSLNVIRDPLALQTPTRRTDVLVTSAGGGTGGVIGAGAGTGAGGGGIQQTQQQKHHHNNAANSVNDGTNGKLPGSDSVYTILIRIPGETEGKNASIRMIQEPGPLPPVPLHAKAKLASSNASDYSMYANNRDKRGASGDKGGTESGLARRPSAGLPPLNAKVIPKPLNSKISSGTMSSSTSTGAIPAAVAGSGGGGGATQPARTKKKKKNQEKKQEKKAAKTLSAILLTFILTWTPYNILVLLRTVLEDNAIPELAWNAFYYMCYINSTINPMCYALCNASFRKTYVRILTCKWDNSKRQAVNRGYYN